MKEAVRHDTRPTTLSHMRADPEKRVADDRRMHGEADPAGEAVDDSAILHVGTEKAKLFARCFQPAHSLSPCRFVVRRNRELVAFPIERHPPDIFDRLVTAIGTPAKIGRGECGERGGQYGEHWVVGDAYKKK